MQQIYLLWHVIGCDSINCITNNNNGLFSSSISTGADLSDGSDHVICVAVATTFGHYSIHGGIITVWRIVYATKGSPYLWLHTRQHTTVSLIALWPQYARINQANHRQKQLKNRCDIYLEINQGPEICHGRPHFHMIEYARSIQFMLRPLSWRHGRLGCNSWDKFISVWNHNLSEWTHWKNVQLADALKLQRETKPV